MKRPKLRYKTEQQLLDAIDAANARAAELGIEADAKETEAKMLFKQADNIQPQFAAGLREKGKERLRECGRLRRLSAMYKDTKARKLGNALAEFRTVFAFQPSKAVGDASVVVR